MKAEISAVPTTFADLAAVQTYLDEDDTGMIRDQMGDTSYWEGTLLDRNEYSSDINEEKIERITRLKRQYK